MKRVVSRVMLIFLLASSLFLALQVRLGWAAAQTVYINGDGSVSPAGAPISSLDDITYTLTGNIGLPAYYGIVVRRSNIVISGSGYTVQGNGTGIGVNVTSISNLTLKNTNINNFEYGIYLSSSSSCTVVGNIAASNIYDGIALGFSVNDTVSGNNVTSNGNNGIALYSSINDTVIGNIAASNNNGIYLISSSNDNTVSGNNVTSNRYGIGLLSSGNNIVSGNNVTSNITFGIELDSSSNNTMYLNNFIGNGVHVYIDSASLGNAWNVAYPAGGNYWSDYKGIDMKRGQFQNVTGSDGLGDKPYIIDVNNTDHYPLMGPFSSLYLNNPSSNTQTSIPCVSNSTVTDFQLTETTISFSVTGPPGTAGFCTVTIPISTLPPPYNVTVDGNQTQYTTIFQDGTVSVIYFTYYHSTHRIVIAGTVHDVALTNVASYETVVGRGYNCTVSVTVTNLGNNNENFNIIVHANATVTASENLTLQAGSSTTVTLTWNTSGFAYGNYTLSAYAWPVPGETNTANNNMTVGPVFVTIPGDVNGDGTVNILDAIVLGNAFLATPGSGNWNPNADINGDGVVNILDAIVLSNNFLKTT